VGLSCGAIHKETRYPSLQFPLHTRYHKPLWL